MKIPGTRDTVLFLFVLVFMLALAQRQGVTGQQRKLAVKRADNIVATNERRTPTAGAKAVAAQTAPTLGNYPNATVITGGNITVTPVSAPTNTTTMTAVTSTNFKGTLAVSPTTGVVTVTNAHAMGTYVVTVTAFGSSGTATKTFTLTVNNPANCTPSSFGLSPAAGSPVSAGTTSQAVAVGDFNGDGKQDLVGTNGTILLGNGNGGFTAASGSPVSVGSTPFSVAVADFNGDGKLDFAVANRGSNNVTVQLGNGSGGFSPAAGSPVSVGTSPQSVMVGDFNSDGKPDLAVANTGSRNMTILLGDGAGGSICGAVSSQAEILRDFHCSFVIVHL